MNSSLKQVRVVVAKVLSTLLVTLREVFDEAAYARFLERAGMASSSESYAAFRAGSSKKLRCVGRSAARGSVCW